MPPPNPNSLLLVPVTRLHTPPTLAYRIRTALRAVLNLHALIVSTYGCFLIWLFNHLSIRIEVDLLLITLVLLLPLVLLLYTALQRRDKASIHLRQLETTSHLLYLTFSNTAILDAIRSKVQGPRPNKIASIELENARTLTLDLTRNMNDYLRNSDTSSAVRYQFVLSVHRSAATLTLLAEQLAGKSKATAARITALTTDLLKHFDILAALKEHQATPKVLLYFVAFVVHISPVILASQFATARCVGEASLYRDFCPAPYFISIIYSITTVGLFRALLELEGPLEPRNAATRGGDAVLRFDLEASAVALRDLGGYHRFDGMGRVVLGGGGGVAEEDMDGGNSTPR